jgi:hypothetical protein
MKTAFLSLVAAAALAVSAGSADARPPAYHGGHQVYSGNYHRGYYGGYRGGYYGGYRGYYGGYRGYYGGYASYYRPYYYGGYGGYGYSNYYSPYYYNSYYVDPYYYSTPYYGCSTGSVYAPVTTVQSVYAYQQPYLPSVTPYGVQPQQQINGYNGVPQQGISGYNGNKLPVMPPVQQQPNNGTYPYDGGPNQPVPLPNTQDSAPAKFAPQAPTTLRLVSTPSQPVRPASQFSFPAYVEDNRASGFAIDRTSPAKKTTNR